MLALLLVIACLGSGLPRFIPQDVTRDNRVDLRDAIVTARNAARVALHSDSGSADTAWHLHEQTLKVVAGLTRIQHIDDDASVFPGPDTLWLTASVLDVGLLSAWKESTPAAKLFSSFTSSPSPRPPNQA
ncbi:MAG: hypothetical protein C4548_11855 [Desulfobacteraceae bacterium]|jgi:hypothetical protein|nr:MAG: hypothetical protein C4548_11855 [Desulfobacteraceae bacterium]